MRTLVAVGKKPTMPLESLMQLGNDKKPRIAAAERGNLKRKEEAKKRHTTEKQANHTDHPSRFRLNSTRLLRLDSTRLVSIRGPVHRGVEDSSRILSEI